MPPDEPVEEWTPRWRDAHGVVHVMGSHMSMMAFTECGVRVAQRSRLDLAWTDLYEAIRDAPTCAQCIHEEAMLHSLRGFALHVEPGIAIVNTKALAKLEFTNPCGEIWLDDKP
jgi:hypothetical protein